MKETTARVLKPIKSDFRAFIKVCAMLKVVEYGNKHDSIYHSKFPTNLRNPNSVLLRTRKLSVKSLMLEKMKAIQLKRYVLNPTK